MYLEGACLDLYQQCAPKPFKPWGITIGFLPETQTFFLGVHMKEWIDCWQQGVSSKEMGLKMAVVRTLTGVVLILSKRVTGHQ